MIQIRQEVCSKWQNFDRKEYAFSILSNTGMLAKLNYLKVALKWDLFSQSDTKFDRKSSLGVNNLTRKEYISPQFDLILLYSRLINYLTIAFLMTYQSTATLTWHQNNSSNIQLYRTYQGINTPLVTDARERTHSNYLTILSKECIIHMSQWLKLFNDPA